MTSISGNETLVELREHLAGRVDTDIVLSRSALSQFVERYLNGELTEAELQETGDLLEMTVEYEDGHEGVIAQVLFEVSSPEVNGQIDWQRATEWEGDAEPTSLATTAPSAMPSVQLWRTHVLAPRTVRSRS